MCLFKSKKKESGSSDKKNKEENSETLFLSQIDKFINRTSKKQWWILGLTAMLSILSIYTFITCYFSLPLHKMAEDAVHLTPKTQNTIIHINGGLQKIGESDLSYDTGICDELSRRIENVENRYSTLVSEIGIWIAFLVGIVTIITLIIGYIFQDKAKEEYQEIFAQLFETNKQLKEFKNKFEDEFLLTEKFYHSCLGLQAIYMNTNFTTPLIKSMVSTMLYDISELKNKAYTTSNDWVHRTDEFLMLYKTLHYIFPLLRNKNVIRENIFQVQLLLDKLSRLLSLQGRLKAILPLSNTDRNEEIPNEAKKLEIQSLGKEIYELIEVIFKQISILSTALHNEANTDIYRENSSNN